MCLIQKWGCSEQYVFWDENSLLCFYCWRGFETLCLESSFLIIIIIIIEERRNPTKILGYRWSIIDDSIGWVKFVVVESKGRRQLRVVISIIIIIIIERFRECTSIYYRTETRNQQSGVRYPIITVIIKKVEEMVKDFVRCGVYIIGQGGGNQKIWKKFENNRSNTCILIWFFVSLWCEDEGEEIRQVQQLKTKYYEFSLWHCKWDLQHSCW